MEKRYFDFEKYAAENEFTTYGFDAKSINHDVSAAIFKDIRAYETKRNTVCSAKKRADLAEFWVISHKRYVMHIICKNYNPMVWLTEFIYETVIDFGEYISRAYIVRYVFNALHDKEVTSDNIDDFMANSTDIDTSEGIYNGLIEYVNKWSKGLERKAN